MSRSSHRLRYGFPLFAVFVAGCGWFGGSPLTSNDSLLRYVPADTPYIFAAVEPLPDEIWAVLEQPMSSARDVLQLAMQNALEELRVALESGGAGPGPGDPGEIRPAFEILAELMSAETLEATGINRDSTYVLYGFGLLPVFRVTLAEGHDMGRVLDRLETLIESQGNVTVAKASVAGQEYRYIASDQARLIAALLENELVLTAVPASLGDAELQSILGLDLPEESIADSGRLAAIADEYGFTSNLAAMLDIERVTATFLDEPTTTDAALFNLMGYEPQGVSAVCRDEIRSLAGVAPALVTGYTELNAGSIAMNLVVEIREDIARGLARIPTAVPALGAATDALFSLGMSSDIPAAREFAATRLDAIEADPFECEFFAGLQAFVPSARIYLNQPLPPIVESIKGFSATVDFGELDFASSAQIPTDMSLSVLLATDDVNGLLAMAAASDPQIAALDLGTDGQITELDLPPAFTDPAVNPFGVAYFVATESQIGVGLGLNGEARLAELMAAPAGDPSTILSMGIDVDAYYGILADAMETVTPLDAAGAPPLEFISSTREMFRSLQTVYSRETIDVRFTGRGIEVPVRLELVQ
jgi:hypothetical protein